MTSFSRLSIALVAVCGVAAALAFRSGGAATVVEITDLEPYDVRTAGFVLDAPAELRVRAVGAEKPRPGGILGMLGVTPPRWLRDEDRQEAWVGNAWILDAATRKVVWELRTAKGVDENDGLREFDDDVRLPKGVYEVHYASVAVPARHDDGQWSRRDRNLADDFAMVVSGAGRPMEREELARARRAFARDAFVSFTGVRDGETRQSGFMLDADAEIDVYAIGEARQDDAFDRGWIMDASTRRVVWELDWDGSQPAGGASKNRVARTTLRLPAGKYVAFYGTDDSHGPDGWNSPPPLDPEFWGLTLSVRDAARRRVVRTFAYEHAPSAAAFVRLTGVRDEEMRAEAFSLARPTSVRLYALGEAGGDDLADYAWLTDARTGRTVWRMTNDRTEHAGGARKNRVADTVLALDAGTYVLRYRADDSHAAGDWNAAAPTDAASYGVTLLTATGEAPSPATFSRAEVRPPEGVIAQVDTPRDDATETVPFTLARATAVEVRAMGEGSGGEMHDYAWLEEAASGRVVWTMRYEQTTHAGGAEKNRAAAARLELPAGSYRLRFRSDDSHGAGDWNAPPPDAPEGWGATITRIAR